MSTLAGLLLASLLAVPATSDVIRPRLQLVLFLERGVTLDATETRSIATLVERLWKPYAQLTVVTRHDTWRPLAHDEVHVFITNRTLPGKEGRGLGWIDFVDGEPQRRVYVSMPAVRTLLDGFVWRGQRIEAWPPLIMRTFVQRAVARAIAHEVGHYLLRTRQHASTGLMQHAITPALVMDARPADDRLLPEEVARLMAVAPAYADAAIPRGVDPE